MPHPHKTDSFQTAFEYKNGAQLLLRNPIALRSFNYTERKYSTVKADRDLMQTHESMFFLIYAPDGTNVYGVGGGDFEGAGSM